MSIEVTELDVLHTAQDEAAQILASARERVMRSGALADSDATAILLQQQEKAELLLTEQRDAAAETERESERAVAGAGPTAREQLREQEAQQARDLLDRQFLAAEMLLASERESATQAKDDVERRAVEALLGAHREAAAVLLRARMVVEARLRVRQPGPE